MVSIDVIVVELLQEIMINEYVDTDDLCDIQPPRKKAKSSTPKHYTEVAGATRRID